MPTTLEEQNLNSKRQVTLKENLIKHTKNLKRLVSVMLVLKGRF